MTCELSETFSGADLERIVFYMLSTRLLFYIAQSVISDDRLRRSLRLADPHGSRTYKLTRSSPEHAPAYMMAPNAGVIKAIVSFYRVNSDTAFERHRSRIPINDLNTVHALKKHLIQFLGLKELTIKYGLGDFDIKLYRMAPKPGGKSDNFAITTDDQWKLELPSMLDDSGSEMNSMYS